MQAAGKNLPNIQSTSWPPIPNTRTPPQAKSPGVVRTGAYLEVQWGTEIQHKTIKKLNL